MPAVRRLAAILAADVSGYSRLMGADEEGTHERLRAHFAELVHPKIEEHRGRVVKNIGDGFLAEFASVVDAVRSAGEIQRGMIDREPAVPEERRIRFRIGINLGDVIVEENDIFGDGVNVAARLEALAEPGGICISRTVRDQIRDRLPYALEDKGEQSVKNIVRPVRVYAMRPEAFAELPASATAPTPATAQRVVAPRLSIIVLPFDNLNNDPEQQYFADAFTEDLTTDLSRIAGMFVISRNTAFTYKNKSVGTRQIGRELSVRYVIEGSVRRSGNRVRITAQLINAETDAHLWAERFDGDTADLFAVQDEITRRIAVALDLELISTEATRTIERPDVLDYIFRGRAAMSRPPPHYDLAEAVSLFERALVVDPGSVEAQSRLATALIGRLLDGLPSSAATDIERAEALTAQALASSPRSPLAHYAKGQVLRARGRPEEAFREYEMVLESNRNWIWAVANLGWCKLYAGSIEESIPLVEQAIRLSPRDPLIDQWCFGMGRAYLLQSRTDEAIVWLEKARSVNPGHPQSHAYLASAYALKGEIERAAAELVRSSEAERRSLREHLRPEGRTIFRGTSDPRLVRSHFFRRVAQGRHAGGVNGCAIRYQRVFLGNGDVGHSDVCRPARGR
jgi:adenylate cyclase